MKLKERRISSLNRTNEKDQSVKKLLVCLKNAPKIFSVILLLSSATAQNEGLHHTIHLGTCLSYNNRMLIFLMHKILKINYQKIVISKTIMIKILPGLVNQLLLDQRSLSSVSSTQ